MKRHFTFLQFVSLHFGESEWESELTENVGEGKRKKVVKRTVSCVLVYQESFSLLVSIVCQFVALLDWFSLSWPSSCFFLFFDIRIKSTEVDWQKPS